MNSWEQLLTLVVKTSTNSWEERDLSLQIFENLKTEKKRDANIRTPLPASRLSIQAAVPPEKPLSLLPTAVDIAGDGVLPRRVACSASES